jgi:hypothetical protein
MPAKDGTNGLRSRRIESIVTVAHANRRASSAGLKTSLSENLVDDMFASNAEVFFGPPEDRHLKS